MPAASCNLVKDPRMSCLTGATNLACTVGIYLKHFIRVTSPVPYCMVSSGTEVSNFSSHVTSLHILRCYNQPNDDKWRFWQENNPGRSILWKSIGNISKHLVFYYFWNGTGMKNIHIHIFGILYPWNLFHWVVE